MPAEKWDKVPRQTVGSLEFYNCFCDHLHPQFDHLLYLHGKFQEGFLPYPGSLTDQPNHIIEIFKILDRFKFDAEQEALQKQRERKK